MLFPRIAHLSLPQWRVFALFQPFLHLHLPVQSYPYGEDPSSDLGASRALARVVTSFASEKLPSDFFLAFKVTGFGIQVKRFWLFSRNWTKEGRNLRKSGVALTWKPIHRPYTYWYERPIDMIRAYRNTQADKNRETLPRRSDSLTFSFLLSKTPPTRQIRKPSLPTI